MRGSRPGRPLGPGAYRRYAVPRELSFEYPRRFRAQDSWKEDVPTLYFALDDGSAGKPASITVTRNDAGAPGYVDLGAAISRDRDWQHARDDGTTVVAGLRARVTMVARQTRSVYLPISPESYYTIVYSAPSDVYATYLPAFTRLLKTLRLDPRAR